MHSLYACQIQKQNLLYNNDSMPPSHITQYNKTCTSSESSHPLRLMFPLHILLGHELKMQKAEVIVNQYTAVGE